VKTITSKVTHYDAAEGRIEEGGVYTIDDEKADRWIAAGVAVAGGKKPDPEPEPEPEPSPEEGEDNGEEEEDEKSHLVAEVHELAGKGKTQAEIGDQLGLSRGQVRRLLAS